MDEILYNLIFLSIIAAQWADLVICKNRVCKSVTYPMNREERGIIIYKIPAIALVRIQADANYTESIMKLVWWDTPDNFVIDSTMNVIIV